MDQKTQRLRARNKAMYGSKKDSILPEFEAKGLGRKNKPADTFPNKQCSHIDGGKEIVFRKKRKDNTTYMVKIIKGGVRCPKTSLYKGKCLEHLG